MENITTLTQDQITQRIEKMLLFTHYVKYCHTGRILIAKIIMVECTVFKPFKQGNEGGDSFIWSPIPIPRRFVKLAYIAPTFICVNPVSYQNMITHDIDMLIKEEHINKRPIDYAVEKIKQMNAEMKEAEKMEDMDQW